MASHFATGTSRRTSPAYCKKGRIPGTPPMQGNFPSTLNAFAQIVTSGSGYAISLNVLVKLRRNATNNGWEGETTGLAYNARIEIDDPPTGTTFTVILMAIEGAVTLAQQIWYHEQPPATDRWNTGLLEAIITPDTSFFKCHVLG